MTREKSTGPRTDPCGTPRRNRKERLLINHTSAPIRKERLSPTSKARRETSRNQFVEKGGMPDSFREIDNRQDRPRTRPGFVKPIRNGLRKVQNLIKCRPTRAETGLAVRENGIRFQKEEKTR